MYYYLYCLRKTQTLVGIIVYYERNIYSTYKMVIINSTVTVKVISFCCREFNRIGYFYNIVYFPIGFNWLGCRYCSWPRYNWYG